MKFIASLFCSCLGAAAGAATYDLNLEVTVGGKTPTKAHVRVASGKTASLIREIDGERVFLDVVARESRAAEESGVLLKFAVGTLGPRGERRVLARPQINAVVDERALVSEDQVAVSVTARAL